MEQSQEMNVFLQQRVRTARRNVYSSYAQPLQLDSSTTPVINSFVYGLSFE